jgi:hypothetical protein
MKLVWLVTLFTYFVIRASERGRRLFHFFLHRVPRFYALFGPFSLFSSLSAHGSRVNMICAVGGTKKDLSEKCTIDDEISSMKCVRVSQRSPIVLLVPRKFQTFKIISNHRINSKERIFRWVWIEAEFRQLAKEVRFSAFSSLRITIGGLKLSLRNFSRFRIGIEQGSYTMPNRISKLRNELTPAIIRR